MTSHKATINIFALSGDFTPSNYICVGATTQAYTGQGSSAQNFLPGRIPEWEFSPASYNPGKTDKPNPPVTFRIEGLAQNKQYRLYAYAQAKNGKYYAIRTFEGGFGITFITLPEFTWDTPKESGKPFSMLASEWNRLIDRVKLIYTLMKGKYNATDYPMTSAVKGDPFKAEHFNQVRMAIGSINATGLEDKEKGDVIKAEDLNLIVNRLNEI